MKKNMLIILLISLIFIGCQPQTVQKAEKINEMFEFSKVDLKFYTASAYGLKPEQRVYNKEFKKSLTDYIWYELNLSRDFKCREFYPVEIEEKWFYFSANNQKKELSSKKHQLFLVKDNLNFEYSAGYQPKLGFEQGKYQLEIVSGGKTLVSKYFNIK